jgi:hypothetical protein
MDGDGTPNAAAHFSPFELEKAAAVAEKKNTAGCNVYVGPALRQGVTGPSGRSTADNFLASAYAWADSDDAEGFDRMNGALEAQALPTSLSVMTGRTPHRRAHLYFRFDGKATKDQVKNANVALKKLLGTDDVEDVCRVEAERARGWASTKTPACRAAPSPFQSPSRGRSPVEGGAARRDRGSAQALCRHGRAGPPLGRAMGRPLHLLDAFMISPRLAVRSPMKRCGKTTLLDVLGCLVMRRCRPPACPLRRCFASSRVIARACWSTRPTPSGRSDDLRGVDSVARAAAVSCAPWATIMSRARSPLCGGRHQDHRHPARYLGRPFDSVVLKRKLLARLPILRIDRVGHLEVLARRAARWAADNAKRSPRLTRHAAGVHSRAADNWRPLHAIADAAGGEWPKRGGPRQCR